MKRTIVFLLSMIFSLTFACSKQTAEEYAMITFMIGEVTKNNVSVAIGDVINEKDVVQTAPDSFCDVKIGQSIIRIKEKSKVVMAKLLFDKNIESTQLGLDVGKMLCKPKKLLKSEKFIVKTPTAVAGVRGTQFIVEADKVKTTRIKVYDGKVQVAKRIMKFDNNVEQVLDVAPVLEEKEKVIITVSDVKKAEKDVERVLDIEAKKGGEIEISALIEQSKNAIVVSEKNIETFAPADFAKENKEIIEVTEKPQEVITKIVKVIKEEKAEPKPDGRLLITRYEIYFIKNGSVMWEGKVVDNPIHHDGKVYIASGKYVFCATTDGPVLWRKNIDNDGKFELRENKLFVSAEGKEITLDIETGQKL
ncbi:MAG TPA: FecR domain-containing protein [Spirochaetota bacterium]|nr:FecR domain-containing protein [Spirochaetota bacterium]HPI88096.1 FecR domain-containing protein [Spirochaetota bacterium]HPR46419.1 FecR domain-containing protein [Spirochaetota bacterium]